VGCVCDFERWGSVCGDSGSTSKFCFGKQGRDVNHKLRVTPLKIIPWWKGNEGDETVMFRRYSPMYHDSVITPTTDFFQIFTPVLYFCFDMKTSSLTFFVGWLLICVCMRARVWLRNLDIHPSGITFWLVFVCVLQTNCEWTATFLECLHFGNSSLKRWNGGRGVRGNHVRSYKHRVSVCVRVSVGGGKNFVMEAVNQLVVCLVN